MEEIASNFIHDIIDADLKENPELKEAARLGIPTMERSHLLGALTRLYDNVIGVCGTHGKTTVTSMITQILYLNKLYFLISLNLPELGHPFVG